MKIAFYIGGHTSDKLSSRIGWALIRHTQKGAYGQVTHVEAIHAEYPDGKVTIVSASLRAKGVRSKVTRLNPLHWLIVDVPQWDVTKSIELFELTKGQPYDWRGALATRLPGSHKANAWFCNEWVSEPFLKESATFGPHHLCAIAMSIGDNVTVQFFNARSK